jgi:flagellar protein FlaF
MGFSVSGSYVILGVAILVSLGMAYGAVNGSLERFSDATAADQSAAIDQYETDITLESTSYNGTHLRFEVVNAGATTLAVSKTDVLVDGRYVDRRTLSTTVDGDGDTDLWNPGQTLRGAVETDAPRRLQIVTEHGVASATSVVLFRQAEQVAFTNSSDLRSATVDGAVTDSYGAIGQSIGPVLVNFGATGVAELPAVEGDTDLIVATANGDRTALTTGAKPDASRLAAGRWLGSDPSVFYVNDTTGNVSRVTADGTSVDLAGTDAAGVAGIGDIDADGADELVYGGNSPDGNSDTVVYVDDDGSTLVGTGQGYGTSGGIGLGEPGDFDGDGQARVPIVDGSNDVLLVAADGTTAALTGSGTAAKAPMATRDVDGDFDPEIVFVGTDGTLRYVDDVGGENAITVVTDGDGDPVTADTDAGAT